MGILDILSRAMTLLLGARCRPGGTIGLSTFGVIRARVPMLLITFAVLLRCIRLTIGEPLRAYDLPTFLTARRADARRVLPLLLDVLYVLRAVLAYDFAFDITRLNHPMLNHSFVLNVSSPYRLYPPPSALDHRTSGGAYSGVCLVVVPYHAPY